MAWATAPEIVLALSLGAEITVHHGVIIPWVKGSPHIFEPVIKDLMVRREQHAKGSLQNALYKLLGNGLYGKTCQGLAGNIAFDTRADVHKEIPESRITNPFLAAHVTGLTRALIGEFMASVPRQRTVYSVTTDGFVTDALLSEISMRGPIATHMMKVRRRLVPEGRAVELLETNYRAEQLLFWRTRGVATIARPEGTKPKLARGGMQAPKGEDANVWFVRTMLERKPFDTITSKEKSPFPHAHRANEDFAIRDKEKALNFEPDFKRKLIEPRMTSVELPNGEQVRHLTCGTRPWNTVEEFNTTRELFERWRNRRTKGGHDRQLKTLEDWDHWSQFKEGTLGIVERALRLVIRAYANGRCALQWGCRVGSIGKRPRI